MITLVVPLEQFAQERQARMPKQTVYLTETDDGAVITVADPAQGVMIRCASGRSLAETKKVLGEKGIAWSPGEWRDGASEATMSAKELPYIAAVAYQSSEPMPGCWMDAYSAPPTVQEVLKNLFDEFQTNGEITDATFEDFMRLANPNVIILTPDETRYHLTQKELPCQ